MSLPDFTSMTLPRRGSGQSSGQSSDSSAGLPAARPTAEGIDIPPLAMPDPAALAAVSSGLPGIAPFLRGPYATMYATRPWAMTPMTSLSRTMSAWPGWRSIPSPT